MKQMIRSMAAETVDRETRWNGAVPREIDYSISLDPRISNGFAESGEGGDNEWGLGVSGNMAFTCAKETIDTVDVAVVNEAVLGADYQMRTDTELLVWRNGRWVSASEVALEMLAATDPAGAARARQLMSEIYRLAKTKTATTKPPTVPATKIGDELVILGDLGLPIGKQVTISGHKHAIGPLRDIFLVETVNGDPVPPETRVTISGIESWPEKTIATLRGCEVGTLRFLQLNETNYGRHDERWKGPHQTLFLRFEVSEIVEPTGLKLAKEK
jgi:hypothetical protein